MTPYTVLYDGREQMPWNFDFYEQVKALVHKPLKTGDYTIEGLEHMICIERKRNTSEIATNIGLQRKRFEAEMERMVDIKYCHIICEFSIQDILDFPKRSSIPPSLVAKIRINGKFILKTLYGYQDKYGVQVHFCGDRETAIQKAVEVFDYTQKMVNG